MVTYMFPVPTNLVPGIKRAARNMEVSVLSANPMEDREGCYIIELQASGPFDLISIGRLMGMDTALAIIGDPSDNHRNFTDGLE